MKNFAVDRDLTGQTTAETARMSDAKAPETNSNETEGRYRRLFNHIIKLFNRWRFRLNRISLNNIHNRRLTNRIPDFDMTPRLKSIDKIDLPLFVVDELISRRYRIIEMIGKGGFGTVYKTFDLTLKKVIALKQLHAANSDNQQKLLRLFHSEVKTAQSLTHRNLCRVYDIGEDEGRFYFTMEYAEGHSLDKHLERKKRLGKEETISIASQICQGLGELHVEGYLHRDLKPANIIRNHDGKILITDFGLAMLAEKIQIDTVEGTVPYIAPEILRRKRPTIQSDLYSLGVLLYEISTGKLPFPGPTLLELVHQIESGAIPPSVYIDDFDKPLEELILSCLSSEPELRPSSAKKIETSLAIIARNNRLKTNPFIHDRAVRGIHFFGFERENCIRIIMSRVETLQSTFVVGDLRMGKTSFLLRVADRIESELENAVVKFFPLRHVSDEYTPVDFWTEALSPLSEHIQNDGVSKALLSAERAHFTTPRLQRLFNILLENNLRLVLFLDEFDYLLRHLNFAPSFFAMMRTLIMSTNSFIIIPSSRFPMKEMDNKTPLRHGKDGSEYFNYFTEIKLTPLDEEAIDELLALAEAYFTKKDRSFIQNLAGSQPYLLQLLSGILFDTKGKQRWHNAAREFFDRVSIYFDDLWKGWTDSCRTVAVVLVVFEFLQRTSGSADRSIKRIVSSRSGRVGIEELSRSGLVGTVNRGRIGHMRYTFNWKGERWSLTSEVFCWWIWELVLVKSRYFRYFDEWLTNQPHQVLLEEKHIREILESIEKVDPSISIDVIIEDFIARLNTLNSVFGSS